MLGNMAHTMNATVSFSIFLSILAVGCSIKCFQCNSATEPDCAEIISNDTTSRFYNSCKGTYNGSKPFCRKTTSYVEYDYEGSNRIVRNCGWINSDNTTEDSCKTSDTDYIKKSFCACFTDGCNSSPKTAGFGLLTILSTLLVVTLSGYC